jgi:hypothetical protein
MFHNVLAAELLKYKRSLALWLVAVGGFFPVMVALLFVETGDMPVVFETIAAYGLQYFDMLALLLTAVITGQAFVMEFSGDKTNRTHAYPVPRLCQYLVKLLVILLLTLAMHLAFLLFLFALGGVFAQDALTFAFAARWIKLALLTWAGHAALVPLTALIAMLCRNAGAYVLVGIGYFAVFMSFAGSDFARFAPPCVPYEILKLYLRSGRLISSDTAGMLYCSAAVFAALLCAGAVCYLRNER